MIPAVILAAGKSARMGSPKAFLKWGDSTFLETIVERLKAAGADGLFVVVRPETLDETNKRIHPGDATVLVNEDPDNDGPISSIRMALDAMSDECWGVLICLVDHPGVDRNTYAALLQEGRDNPGQIVVPVCQKREGHPVLFPAEVFDDLRAVPKGKGADAVLEQQRHRVVELDVADAGVLRDIDTPDEYQNAAEMEGEV